MKTTSSLAGILLGVALAANAAPLKTDVAHSSVSAVFKQMDVPVESSFKRFDARIDYDAAHPDKASARVDIDTASFDMGQADYNKEIAKKEWFNSAQFPKATFVSSSIKPAGSNKLTVTGKLTIKGKTAEVSFPLNVKPEGGRQVFEGQLPIKRRAFNVGEGEWQDTSIVADDIVIKFRVAAG
ncbi:YceI family protein [Massilia sp. 2TAF26]|uniref:YceI family protein n=1 Tax=Massilia sp. 2TAF26 TaxID=3233012 RepID=UPI003F9BC46D